MFSFLRKIIGHKSRIRFAYYFCKSFLAAVIYRFPSKKIKVIGVTGTDGKTTTVNLIAHLLNSNGLKTGMISTTAFLIGSKKIVNKTKRTSVSPFLMQSLLRQMYQSGCKYVVLEVSSHALEQKRFWGVDFDVAVLTNITPEHLDYHKNMEEYRSAKAILFQSLSQSFQKKNQPKIMVLNENDPVFTKFWQYSANRKLSYSLTHSSDFKAENILLQAGFSEFVLCFHAEREKIRLNLIGEFNIENALAASAVCFALGLNLAKIKIGLESFAGVEGRMEKIEAGQTFDVIVDFALTPEALRKLFETTRQFTQGRIIGVLGCAGERDREKRPVIGKMAAEMLDIFILTDDETYSEDGNKIRDEIKNGIAETQKKQNQDWYEIPNRLEAIRSALKIAQKGDTVLIPGMGSECTRNIGGKEIEWDERKVVKRELKKIQTLKT